MKALQRSGVIAITLLLAILLVACGGTATPAATNPGMKDNNPANGQNNGQMTGVTPPANATPMPTQTPMATGGTAITPGETGDMAAFIHTGKAAINGRMVNVLLTKDNFALYYYMPDARFTSTCTNACAQEWPPLLAPAGMTTVTSSVALPKELAVRQTPNGAQVFYDGHALYTYIEDTQPGNAQGRGMGNQWYLVGFEL